MQASETRWRPWRIALFLAIGAGLYAALFVWSDAVLRAHGQGNAFFRIAEAPAETDWLVLGASHVLPLGFDGTPGTIADATGQELLPLGVTGGGPFVMRLVAERYFADHAARHVLILPEAFSFLDQRWNAGRMGDADMVAKIPADRKTVLVMARAMEAGLRWQTFAGYATGFSRINDRTRFQTDRWEAEDRFDSAPRPSDAADRARIAFLYPGPPQPGASEQGFRDLAAIVELAHARKAEVVVALPPLPERFRARMPDADGFEVRVSEFCDRLGVPFHDFSGTIPEARFYFDTDHLNRSGIARWLDEGLGALLGGADDGGQ